MSKYLLMFCSWISESICSFLCCRQVTCWCLSGQESHGKTPAGTHPPKGQQQKQIVEIVEIGEWATTQQRNNAFLSVNKTGQRATARTYLRTYALIMLARAVTLCGAILTALHYILSVHILVLQ